MWGQCRYKFNRKWLQGDPMVVPDQLFFGRGPSQALLIKLQQKNDSKNKTLKQAVPSPNFRCSNETSTTVLRPSVSENTDFQIVFGRLLYICFDNMYRNHCMHSRMSQYRQSPTKSRFSEYFEHMNTSLPMIGQKTLAILGEVQISAYVLIL